MTTSSILRSARRWWLGLIPLTGLGLATSVMMTDVIESDISARTAQLRSGGDSTTAQTTWASIHVEGRDAIVTGIAPAPARRMDLATAVDTVTGVRLVADAASDLPAMEPFLWSAVKDNTQVVLTGFVPPEGARAELIKQAHANFPSAKIQDNMKDASGAPEDFPAMSSFALTKLAALSVGFVELQDRGFSIRGAAPTRDAYDAIMAAAHNLPAPMTLRSADVTGPAVTSPIETSSIERRAEPSSYVWFARHDGKHVALTGSIPDEAARTAILAAARRHFGSIAIDDKMQTRADGAPAGFTAAAEVGMVQLARLEAGSAAITDAQLTLVGLAANEEIAGDANTAVAKVTGTIAGTSTVVARPKAAQQVAIAAPTAAPADTTCSSGLKDASTQGRIQFESLRAVILKSSMPVIDGIAGLLKKCPDLRVEISGHTDNTGLPSFNKPLSLRRASAVTAALVKAGIDRKRLTSAGHGAAKPIASNNSNSGRAANRRIEFNIIR
jgi:OmpA-OmpF porin, OOP family